MGTTLARALLCLSFTCIGCASTGMIHGTVSTRPPTESSPSPEAHADPALVRGSVVDAVVYIEDLHSRVESGFNAAHGSSRLELKDQTLRPRILVVPVGTSVGFANHDSLFHNIFSVSPAKPFNLGRIGRGESKRVTFDKPGLINVYCSLHPNMAAYILVVPNHAFTRPDSLGRFVLPTLPKGHYVVNVWHPDFPAIRREVTISRGVRPELLVKLGS